MLPRDVGNGRRTRESTSRVVVGVDGSFGAIRAARWAAAVAETFTASLDILHADSALAHNTSGAITDSADAILQSAEGAVSAQFKSLHITRTHVVRPVDEALIQASRSAFLVVLGTDRPSPLAAAHSVGATTMAVAGYSACPVVAWRGETITPTRQPIVAGIDHDRDSEVAIAAAFEFANRLGLGIIAVHAWTTPQLSGDESQRSTIAWRRLENDARQHLSDALSPWVDIYPNVDVTEIVDHADPGMALLHWTQGAQLVAVGRGRMRAGAVPGSTGLDLLQRSAIPVMMCRSVDSGD